MIVFALIILIACIWYIKYCSDVQIAIAHKGHTYYVNNNQSAEEKQRKVELLHDLRSRTNLLIEELKNPKYENEYSIQTLLRKAKARTIQFDELPNAPSLYRTFAFNVNKGERISICLSSENTINDLFFVILHEVAHSMTEEYAHNERFWDNFKRLIEISIETGLYENNNYSKDPKKFCNLVLNHNPYFDKYVLY